MEFFDAADSLFSVVTDNSKPVKKITPTPKRLHEEDPNTVEKKQK
jgi:hypothetical protein